MVDLHLLERRIAPRVQRYVAMALAFVLTVAVALQLAPPAHAAAEANASGVTASVTLNGQKYNGLDVVAPGDTLHMQVQYGQDTERGSTARFTVSPNAVFSTDVPAGNTAIERIDRVDDHTLAITFAEDWGVTNQGVFGLQFSLTEVEHTATDTITWSVDGKETSLDIIVSPKGNEFGPEHDEYSKSVTPSNLNSFVTVEKDTVKLKEGIQDQKLTYTLSVTTKEAKEALTIADTLPAGLSYDQDSFSATMVTWDESGLNKGEPQEVGFTPAIDQGSFSGKLAAPGPSKATITYTATITDVAAVEALLQEQYDKLEGDARQNFRIDLKNTASFHDGENAQQKKTAKVILQGTKDSIGPDLRAAFKKSADWSSKTQRAGKAGDLQKPINIAYKMTADLRQLQSVGLNQNVIVEDTLPEQLRWVTDADNFISISGLTATRFQGEAPTFQESSQPGEYLVDGNTLWVNVGQDVTRKHSITAQAQLLTVKGITPTEASPPEGALSHQFRNTAAFHYGSDKPYERSRDAAVVLLPAPGDDGDNNEYVFKKSGKAEHTRIQPGESVDIVYTFTVAKDNGIDMRNSTIVDYLEVAAFDLGENLDNVRLRGSYDGKPLGQEDFHLTQNDAGNLEITLNDTGKQVVTNRGTDKDFVVVVELTTKVFEGKETKTIINKATLFGEDNVPLYWSTTESQSTSYGDEAEVRKRVFDKHAEQGTQQWVESVDALQDAQDQLVDNPFVYQITFMPHGSFNNVVIRDVIDELPDGVEFLGFVDRADAGSEDLKDKAAQGETGPVDIGGNLEATYENNTVTISQQANTQLDANDGEGQFSAYFAVEVTTTDKTIVNAIKDSKAEIVPTKASVSWSKVDDQDDPQLLGGSEWKLTGPDGYEETIVDNGDLDAETADGKFSVTGLLPGDYTLVETKAPTGYELSHKEHTFTIDRGEHLRVDLGEVVNVPTPPVGPDAQEQPDSSGSGSLSTTGATVGLLLVAGFLLLGFGVILRLMRKSYAS